MTSNSRDWDDDYLTRAWNLPKESFQVPAPSVPSQPLLKTEPREPKFKRDPTFAEKIWSQFAAQQRKNRGYAEAPKAEPARVTRPEDEPGNALCTFFAGKGCAAGDSCRFRHVEPEEPAVDFFVDLLLRFEGFQGKVSIDDILYSLALDLEDGEGYFDLEDHEEVAAIYGEENADILFELVNHVPDEEKEKGHTAILEDLISEFVALRNKKPEADAQSKIDEDADAQEDENKEEEGAETPEPVLDVPKRDFKEHFNEFLKDRLESLAGPDAFTKMQQAKFQPTKPLQYFEPFKPTAMSFVPPSAIGDKVTNKDADDVAEISFEPLSMDTFSPSPAASNPSNTFDTTEGQAKKKKKKKKKKKQQQAEVLHPLFFNQTSAPPPNPASSAFVAPGAAFSAAAAEEEDEEDTDESQRWVEMALAERSVLIEAALRTGLASSEDAAEVALLYAEREISSDIECGICYEVVLKTSKSRFGLLTGCSHPFCLSCIREWRGRIDLPKHTVRACPICRQTSHFVIPSDRFITDPTRKALITREYNVNQSKIPCRNFNYGEGECPFGSSCFYAHLNPDGTPYHHGGYSFVTDEDGNFVNMKNVLTEGLDRRFMEMFSASGGGQDAQDDDATPKKPGAKGKTV